MHILNIIINFKRFIYLIKQIIYYNFFNLKKKIGFQSNRKYNRKNGF